MVEFAGKVMDFVGQHFKFSYIPAMLIVFMVLFIIPTKFTRRLAGVLSIVAVFFALLILFFDLIYLENL